MGKSSVLSLLVESLAREEQINRGTLRTSFEICWRWNVGDRRLSRWDRTPDLETSLIHHMVGGIGIAREGLHFDSSDGEPTHLIFLILAPQAMPRGSHSFACSWQQSVVNWWLNTRPVLHSCAMTSSQRSITL
ncbi:MAG: hypothetical protein R3B91_07665 [Planctomycetaceae bacterium]